MNEHVTSTPSTETRHPLLREAVHGLRLRPRREIDAFASTVDERCFDRRTEDRFADPDLNPLMEFVTDPVEAFVVLDTDLDVDIARWGAPLPRSTSSGEPQPGPVFNSAGDVDRDRALHRDQSTALALRAWLVDRLSLPPTLGARGNRHDPS